MESDNWWQLEGESDLNCITIPEPPKAGPGIVRLTHSNSLAPFDEGVSFYVRIGNPDKPTEEDDLDSAKDWVKATLVEELVYVDDDYILRSAAQEPFEDETLWEGTYEAKLVFPPGRCSIEIKIVSEHPELLGSRVLNDWEIKVG